MTIIPNRLAGPTAAASGDNTAYTPDVSRRVIITRIKVVNNSTAKVTVKIGIGGSADANLIFPEMVIQKKATLDQETFEVLNGEDEEGAVDVLYINASATGTTYTIFGYEDYPHL